MINKQWHEQHRLARKSTSDERIAWHLEHAQRCGCRPIPLSIVALLHKRGIDLPRPPLTH